MGLFGSFHPFHSFVREIKEHSRTVLPVTQLPIHVGRQLTSKKVEISELTRRLKEQTPIVRAPIVRPPTINIPFVKN